MSWKMLLFNEVLSLHWYNLDLEIVLCSTTVFFLHLIQIFSTSFAHHPLYPPVRFKFQTCSFSLFFPLFLAGRRQFARHEWAQKAAYLLGCSLEELSSSIFKHQAKGLQHSTSFRGGMDEASHGDNAGTGVKLSDGLTWRRIH